MKYIIGLIIWTIVFLGVSKLAGATSRPLELTQLCHSDGVTWVQNDPCLSVGVDDGTHMQNSFNPQQAGGNK